MDSVSLSGLEGLRITIVLLFIDDFSCFITRNRRILKSLVIDRSIHKTEQTLGVTITGKSENDEGDAIFGCPENIWKHS